MQGAAAAAKCSLAVERDGDGGFEGFAAHRIAARLCTQRHIERVRSCRGLDEGPSFAFVFVGNPVFEDIAFTAVVCCQDQPLASAGDQ